MDIKTHMKWNFPSVKRYIEDHKKDWWILGFFLLLAYGIKIMNISISHDTEAIMAVPDNLYDSWFRMGRYGLIFIKKLLGTYWFNPYVASFMMVVMMLINCVLWGYLFYWLHGGEQKRRYLTWISPVIFFTSMIMGEQSAFTLQSYEVNVAILLVGVALLVLYKVILQQSCVLWYVSAMGCCILAFSTYQSLLPLFMAGAALSFLLIYDSVSKKGCTKGVWKFYWVMIGKLIGTFFLSYVLYQGINVIVLRIINREPTSYIADQILWGKEPFEVCLNNILTYIRTAMIGDGFFYSFFNIIVYGVILLFALVRIKKKEPAYFMYVMALLFCFICPFLLPIIMGSAPTARTAIVLPFVVGFLIQYFVNVLFGQISFSREKAFWKYMYGIVIGIIFVLSMNQSLSTARLYYTQYLQYEEDVRLATKISDRIERLNMGESPDVPVVFVGCRQPQKNESSFEGKQLELIGRSFFEVSFSTEHGTWVMTHFMDTLGYSYLQPTIEQINMGEALSVDMPAWPNEGCVAYKDGVIIVNLG